MMARIAIIAAPIQPVQTINIEEDTQANLKKSHGSRANLSAKWSDFFRQTGQLISQPTVGLRRNCPRFAQKLSSRLLISNGLVDSLFQTDFPRFCAKTGRNPTDLRKNCPSGFPNENEAI